MLWLVLLQLGVALGQDISGFYHTSTQIETEIDGLKSKCPFLSTETLTHADKSLLTVTIEKPSASAKEHRILVFFGEHARELISPETGLMLIRRLCECSQPHPDPALCPDAISSKVVSLLSSARIVITPNINRASREQIEEKGQYCLRANPNGVDLNRNWDDHWKPQGGSEYSGTGAFSESETSMLRDTAKQLQPTIFLTIHSGCLGMWSPYSYEAVTPSGGGEQVVLDVLSKLNSQYCNCNVGSAGGGLNAILSGTAAGTCLDYMWDAVHTPYAMAFEIYSDSTSYMRFAEHSLSETKSRARRAGVRDTLETPPPTTQPLAASMFEEQSCFSSSPSTVTANPATRSSSSPSALQPDAAIFLQQQSAPLAFNEALVSVSEGETSGAFPLPSNPELEGCLRMFNPVSEDVYHETTLHWSEAVLSVFEGIIERHAQL